MRGNFHVRFGGGRTEKCPQSRGCTVTRWPPTLLFSLEATGNLFPGMLAAQRAIGVAGDTTKVDIKELAPTDYRWNSYLAQQIISKGSVEWDANLAGFNLYPRRTHSWNPTGPPSCFEGGPVSLSLLPASRCPDGVADATRDRQTGDSLHHNTVRIKRSQAT